MGKILVMTEGPNELGLMNLLLDEEKLVFTRDDLLDLRPFHARQLTSPHLLPSLTHYHGDLSVYRIGDALNDKLKIPAELLSRIEEERKFCTKPELEILLVIAENRAKDFEKEKSKKSPKEFCKEHLRFQGKRYDNSTEFFLNYFSGRIEFLVHTIKEYKRTHKKHKRDEEFLADLLNPSA